MPVLALLLALAARVSVAQAPRAPLAPPAPPSVCSGLDFSGVTWPGSMTYEDKLALSLALNVSGSFEGPHGWGNITDDFDDQGVSLGLLNQNLGQGSLQPLLVKMRDKHPAVLSNVFSPAHLTSLLGMLAAWKPPATPSSPAANNRLDEPAPGQVMTSPAAAASVAWARQNLYINKAFDPVWKAELVAMAQTPEFVSLQISAAVWLHDQALSEQASIGVKELRAYLMMFDVAVQNGGLYDADVTDYRAWLTANPAASNLRRLEKIRDLRLRHVRRRFVVDVHSRKTAIIHGTGRVHGNLRDLPKQYCYDGLWQYK
ncbi:MAG: peptidoglycan-binding domain 1 protein [Elusimicrobia bacterium]|nr:MAG: peptidoglycan-binding domain 1 protein [Elusimicrobiota bacterium]